MTKTPDGKYVITGGFDKKLHLIEEANPANRREFQLKYYAYCCHQAGDLLYIGGMNFIQIFDMAKLVITQTINAGKLIYKIIPIDSGHFLCGGSYILDVLRLSDLKMIEVCKFETSIYDIAYVARVGDYIDYALATWEGVQFVRINIDQFNLEILPVRLREKESINNVQRVRDNVIIFADGSNLILYDRLTDQELLSFWNDSQIRSIKPLWTKAGDLYPPASST